MTIQELWEIVLNSGGLILHTNEVRGWFLALIIIAWGWGFFVNHLSIKKLALYALLFLMAGFVVEIPRDNLRRVLGYATQERYITSVVYGSFLAISVWLGLAFAFTLRRVLDMIYGGFWASVARQLDRAAAWARKKDDLDKSSASDWDGLRQRLEAQSKRKPHETN